MLAADFRGSGSSVLATDYNANVGAIRQSAVVPGPNMLVNQSPMGGTSITLLRRPHLIRSKSELKYAPFALRVVNVGTQKAPVYRKLFYFPEGAVDVCGGWALCDNRRYAGSQAWAQSGDWYYVADATGDYSASHVPEQENVDYVFLHVLHSASSDTASSAIVTNSQKIPEDFNGYETDCICIGRFTCPTSAEWTSKGAPRVREQYVTGQVQVYGDLYPLRLGVVNIGSDSDPEWVKMVYIPGGAVRADGEWASCENRAYPAIGGGGTDWYFVSASGNLSTPALQEDVRYVYLHVKGPRAAVTNSEDIPAAFSGEETDCICLGEFSRPSAAAVRAGARPVVVSQFVVGQVRVESDDTKNHPFKLKYVENGSGGGEWRIYLPEGALTVANATSPGYAAILNTSRGGGWYAIDGAPSVATPHVYLFGCVEYSTGEYTGIDIESANMPNYWRYFVRFSDAIANTQVAIVQKGLTFDTNRPWRYFRARVGSVDGTFVTRQDMKGAVSVMAPVETMGGGSEDGGLEFSGSVEDGNIAFAKVTTETDEETGVTTTTVALENSQLNDGLADRDFLKIVAGIFDIETTGSGDSVRHDVSISVEHIRDADCQSGGDCFAMIDADGYLTHSQNADKFGSGSLLSRRKVTLVQNAFTFAAGQDGGLEGTALNIDKLLAKAASLSPTGAVNGALVLGVNQSAVDLANNQDGAEVCLFSGLPAGAVRVGAANDGSDVFLSALVPTVQGVGPRIAHAMLDDTSPWEINTSNFASATHAHGNISNDGRLTNTTTTTDPATGEAVSTTTPVADVVVVTDGNGRVTADHDLSKSRLIGACAALQFREPGQNEEFDPYVTGLVLKGTGTFFGTEVGYIEQVSGGNSPGIEIGTTYGPQGGDTSSASLSLTIAGAVLSAEANKAKLANAPTVGGTDKTSLAIATCGWVASNFASIDLSSDGIVTVSGGALSRVQIGMEGGKVAPGDHTHDFTGTFAPADHEHLVSDITDWNAQTVDFLIDDDIGVSVQEYSDKLTELESVLSNEGEVPLSQIFGNFGNAAIVGGHTDTQVLAAVVSSVSNVANGKAAFAASSVYDPDCASSGDCLAYFDSNKYLAHLGNTGMTVTKLQKIDAAFSYTGTGKNISKAALDYEYLCSTQNVSNVRAIGFNGSSSSPTKAVSLIEVASLAPKTGDTNPAANKSYAPAELKSTTSSETDAQKIARVGTSSFAARADHQHPIPKVEVPAANKLDTLKSGYENGKASTDANTKTFGYAGDNGLKFYVVSRLVRDSANLQGWLYCREVTITGDGRIAKIGAEGTPLNVYLMS